MNIRRLRLRTYRKTGGPRQIGHRCKVYCAGCIVCESYRFLDQHGRFPSFNEVRPICDAEGRKEYEAWLTTDEGRAWTDRRNARDIRRATQQTQGETT